MSPQPDKITPAELSSHAGKFFAVWHEEWESRRAEDITERLWFSFHETAARTEYAHLLSRAGEDPDVIRESIGLFALEMSSDGLQRWRDEVGESHGREP